MVYNIKQATKPAISIKYSRNFMTYQLAVGIVENIFCNFFKIAFCGSQTRVYNFNIILNIKRLKTILCILYFYTYINYKFVCFNTLNIHPFLETSYSFGDYKNHETFTEYLY